MHWGRLVGRVGKAQVRFAQTLLYYTVVPIYLSMAYSAHHFISQSVIYLVSIVLELFARQRGRTAAAAPHHAPGVLLLLVHLHHPAGLEAAFVQPYFCAGLQRAVHLAA